jgi:hypothetical protein
VRLHTVRQKRCPLQGKNCFGTVVILNVLLAFYRLFNLHAQKEVLSGSGFIEKLEIFCGPLPITIPSDLLNLFAVLLWILSPVPQISIVLKFFF